MSMKSISRIYTGLRHKPFFWHRNLSNLISSLQNINHVIIIYILLSR